ncbi:hypothetical protein CN271_01515 [Bacillus cereus]|uniref:hypothetical protein n=1 Tax=Bacillus cereus TaxID=1396 RepID=UPI000BEC3D70|nr:hypothetical protein [Bacillus cereus]PEE35815.1 hypothetical protein CON59_14330 [Bacillus cereus]PET45809.1 hypothetical protein CN523_14935 [Bacillus cereus]PFA53491.1 hypothetical protein CN389_19885 [Bacillus cereus]PFD80329.1 hypothetical protein CN271_01515 [Bacillus cereus]PFE84843.1 hypothetical protein CN319_00680 [Bacillus cereus]
MNKYSVFSLATLAIFIILFYTMLSRVSLGTLGKPFIIAMFLFPLLGTFLGLKAKKGSMKWLLIILNIIAIFIIGYLSLLAFGMRKR